MRRGLRRARRSAWNGLGLLAGALLTPACGAPEPGFVPPLLLDRAGLEAQVALAGEAAGFGRTLQGRLPEETSFAAAVVGVAGDTQLELSLASPAEVGLALYGPRRADGLFGAARSWTPQTRQGGAALFTSPLAAGGDYLVLLATPGHAGADFGLTVTCLAGCAAPRCPALVCGLYCPTGLAPDAEGCPTCACAAGCAGDADCPLGFGCQAGSCRREASDCACAAEPYAPVCGLDGRTYANTCELACAGIGLAAEGACATPACATDADCPAGMRCQAGDCRPACDCGAAPFEPVCGRDGQSYPSACELDCAGVGLDHQGPCDTCNPEVCGDGLDNDCDGYADEGCAGSCAADDDCPAGQLCQAGTCAAALACASGLDCPAGQACLAGVCRPQGGCGIELCNGLDDDCDGLVDEGCPACRADTDCAAGERCEVATGRCEPACQPEPEVCDGVDNDCDGLIDEGCAACANDLDCAAGQLCLDGLCVAPPGCASDADCPAGLVCLAGQCARPLEDLDGDGYAPPEDCDDSDASVHPGALEQCDGLDNDCDGLTDEGCPAPCASDADCAAGMICHEGVCVTPCRSDADCPAGQVCVGGVCSP